MAPVIFLFVVDTCQDEENLQALKVTHTYTHHHHYTHTPTVSLSLLGISPALSESHSPYCPCGTYHIWKNGKPSLSHVSSSSECACLVYVQVQLHELGCDGYAKSYVFRGSKDVNTKQLQEHLGLAGGPMGRPQAAASAGRPQQQQQQQTQNR